VKLAAGNLALQGLDHGFFTREGGVSEGLYASLNCGYGSGDAPERVAENRARAAAALGVAPDRIVTCHQIHGRAAVAVERAWSRDAQPKADAMATRNAGIALGILTADCVPVLLADPDARIIGAAHAGWRGALTGVVEEAVRVMTTLGADPSHIHGAIGPAIGQASYEVGPEFPAPFLAQDPANERLFAATANGKFRFDLPGYVAAQLKRLGLRTVERVAGDTAAEPERFFSYRRTRLRGEHDYGRLLSAIALL
jgi:YfiH family protein